MSGHSKWSQIKRQKHTEDQKRGLLFSKLAKSIAIAVRQGGGIIDPEANFHLRLVIDRAKQANMPKENIERAIQRAESSSGSNLEEVMYGGYGPGGVALIIQAATDNKTRTVQTVKHILDQKGATLAEIGAVEYMFKRAGSITVEKNSFSSDEILSFAVDSGAEDMEEDNNVFTIYTKPNKLHKVKQSLEKMGLSIKETEFVMKPTVNVSVTDENIARKILSLMDAIENSEDIVKVYANFNIRDDILQKLLINKH